MTLKDFALQSWMKLTAGLAEISAEFKTYKFIDIISLLNFPLLLMFMITVSAGPLWLTKANVYAGAIVFFIPMIVFLIRWKPLGTAQMISLIGGFVWTLFIIYLAITHNM